MKTIYTTNDLLNAIGTRLNEVKTLIKNIEHDAGVANKDKRFMPGFTELNTEKARLNAAITPLINDYY